MFLVERELEVSGARKFVWEKPNLENSHAFLEGPVWNVWFIGLLFLLIILLGIGSAVSEVYAAAIFLGLLLMIEPSLRLYLWKKNEDSIETYFIMRARARNGDM